MLELVIENYCVCLQMYDGMIFALYQVTLRCVLYSWHDDASGLNETIALHKEK